MPILSSNTLTEIQQERVEGLALQGVDGKFLVNITSIIFFWENWISAQKKKDPSKSWYEELHQVTLPAHWSTATKKKCLFVQWHFLEVKCLKYS